MESSKHKAQLSADLLVASDKLQKILDENKLTESEVTDELLDGLEEFLDLFDQIIDEWEKTES